ncbi:uncharacterized protein [Amphiura filiformis]|uniref:uncharacterized protein n=1 Tax=Amphiura filiformis TaxID=82378 RepID=UPI003B21B16D
MCRSHRSPSEGKMLHFVVIASAILHFSLAYEITCNVADASIEEDANRYCGIITGKYGVSTAEPIGPVHYGNSQEAGSGVVLPTETQLNNALEQLELVKHDIPSESDMFVADTFLFDTGDSSINDDNREGGLKGRSWSRRKRRGHKGDGSARIAISDHKLTHSMLNGNFDNILSSIGAKVHNSNSRNKRQIASGDMFLNLPKREVFL